MSEVILKRFDIVQITTTKNVNYLSGPSSRPATPDGVWSVIGFVGGMVLIARDRTVVKIPLEDLRRIGSYLTTDNFMNRVRGVGEINVYDDGEHEDELEDEIIEI